MKIVTVEQMRDLERRSENAGVSMDVLMEKAGLEVARRARHLLGHLPGVPVLVLVGPGNNGGDGLVTARHLQVWDASVTAFMCTSRDDDPKLDLAGQTGVHLLKIEDDANLTGLKEALNKAHMVIDAVLGTGRSRPLEGVVKNVIVCLKDAQRSNSGLRLLALDLPTGLDPDTGEVDPNCPKADATVALGYPKTGVFSFPGAEHVGQLEVVDIGIPSGLDDDVTLKLMDGPWARSLLPSRPADANKGTFGRVFVVAGSVNYVGAAYLACAAAYRVGAGIVTLAAARSLQPMVASMLAESTHFPLPESELGILSKDGALEIKNVVSGYSALLVGCGMGQAPSTQALLEELLLNGTTLPPTLIDADGLNNLAGIPNWWQRLRPNSILTPHPGEMSRLMDLPTAEIQADRIGSATKAAGLWKQIVVLKGAYSVVASPDGRAMVSPFASSNLATAGTGDVLSGIIGGLLAQGLSPSDAASLGVYLHGAAGETLRGETGDTGMLASDLLPVVPKAIKKISKG